MWFKFKAWFASLFHYPVVHIKLSDVIWQKDDLGWYWTAPVYRGKKKCHVTGNYYQTEERLAAPDDSIVNIGFGRVMP